MSSRMDAEPLVKTQTAEKWRRPNNDSNDDNND